MSALRMFIPITKVDAARRLVYGLATAETEDRAGEICDYASTKPLYEKWSEEIAKSTRGKSFGNLRAMHGPVAAGKVTAITFNDAGKQMRSAPRSSMMPNGQKSWREFIPASRKAEPTRDGGRTRKGSPVIPRRRTKSRSSICRACRKRPLK